MTRSGAKNKLSDTFRVIGTVLLVGLEAGVQAPWFPAQLLAGPACQAGICLLIFLCGYHVHHPPDFRPGTKEAPTDAGPPDYK